MTTVASWEGRQYSLWWKFCFTVPMSSKWHKIRIVCQYMQASASLQLPYRVVERLYPIVKFLRTLLTNHVNVQGHLHITSNACVQSQTKREFLVSLFLEKRNKITQNFLTPKHDLRKKLCLEITLHTELQEFWSSFLVSIYVTTENQHHANKIYHKKLQAPTSITCHPLWFSLY
jgi:hypothetical protein